MKSTLLSLIVLLLSCQPESQVVTDFKQTERTEAVYIFGNGLAFDGCEEMVRLQADSSLNKLVGFKPSPATLPLLQKALTDLPPKPAPHGRAAIMRFSETGNQVDLQCGWGSRTKMPEIEILEIKAP